MSLSFQSRIALLFATLFVAVQALTVACLFVTVKDSLFRQLDQDLRYAEQAFASVLSERAEHMAGEARLLVADYGFRSAIASGDGKTIRSALENLMLRIRAQRAFFIAPQGNTLIDTQGQRQNQLFIYPDALMRANTDGQAVLFGLIDGKLHEWAIVPVLAPLPIGWVALVRTVDQQRIEQFRKTSVLPLHISLAELALDQRRVLIGSAPDAAMALLDDGPSPDRAGPLHINDLDSGLYVGRLLGLPSAGDEQLITAVLQINVYDLLSSYRMMAWIVGGVLLLGLLATLIGSVVIARQLSLPIRALAGAGAEVASGQFASPLAGRDDELGQLADTFVRAAQLAGQLGELRHKDQQRRELVASVSHDLRSPLAAMRGFLETMQRKADSLPAEQQQQFLATAVRQAEKVSRLAQELFELAKLECDDSRWQPEAFNLAELIQDVLQKHRLQAEQGGVQLSAELRRDLPLVQADIALIERLLTNLIDNALRHTPAGGSVQLDAWLQDARITVEVGDSGCGIAADYLDHLGEWDSPLARRARAQGGGFGLIVVSKIAQIHGSQLKVASALGAGSRFSFSLPLA